MSKQMKQEALILLEFQEKEIPGTISHFVMKHLDSQKPLVQVNDRLYEGIAEQPIGTFMLDNHQKIDRIMRLSPLKLDHRTE
jgi:hypothetical protein